MSLCPFCLCCNQTVAYTGKHTLPNDSHTKEILIRRHASIRRSLRPGSFQTTVSRKSLTMAGIYVANYASLISPLILT